MSHFSVTSRGMSGVNGLPAASVVKGHRKVITTFSPLSTEQGFHFYLHAVTFPAVDPRGGAETEWGE